MPPETSGSDRHSSVAPPLARGDATARALANALPQIIWTCDALGRLEWVNERWFELTGLTEDQTLNDKGALEAVHPDDRAELARRWGKAVDTALPTEVEYRIRTARGDYRWHIGRIAPVLDASGEIVQWLAAAFDIHHRHEVEDALRASEHRFEAIFQLSVQPLSINRESDGTFLDVNDAFLALTGFSRDEILGKTSVEVGLWTAEEREAFVSSLSGGPLRNREVTIRSKSGQAVRVMASTGRADIDGVPCMVSSSSDVTAQRANDDALRRSEASARARADELAALMDAVPAAVWVAYDRDCREIRGNSAAYDVVRMRAGQNLSKTSDDPTATQHFTIAANGAELPDDQLPLERAARGEVVRDYETDIRFTDGEITHLYGSAVPLLDLDGTPRGAIGAFLDVTRLKEAEEALRRADRRKDEFLALLSHELRNPLTPILTAARLLERRADAEDRHDLDVIVRQVKHLVRLVDDLLDVARVARGAVTLSMTHMELATVVSRAVEATRPLFEERGHHLDIALPAAGLAVEGDEVRLTQVIDNLLSNAARYTPPGGTVTVSGAREGDAVVLRVRDTGVGLEASLHPDMFDIFVQGGRGADRGQGGLGIGLSLVRALTELHGGTATARSDGPGLGSEFTIRLPATAVLPNRSADGAASVLLAERAAQPQTATRVLLVDDHRDVLDGLSRLLRIIGYDVRAIANSRDAITAAEAFRPEIAILDIGLPEMDGFTLARELRARLSDAPPMLIALSGYNQAHDRQRSSASGFAMHLVKPVDVDELMEALGSVVTDRPVSAPPARADQFAPPTP